MKDENKKIQNRLEKMKNFYLKAENLLENIPDSVPSKTKEKLKSAVLGDKDLKNLMEGIDSHRPPRFFLIGRTGVGKSSLINALCQSYAASVSDVKSGTKKAEIYKCMNADRILMEILDSRGLSESESLDDKISAEKMLREQIQEFSPDAAIMMLNCTHRDDIISDIEFMKKVSKEYAAKNNIKLPIIVVVNKCDEMAPSRFKDPESYPKHKIDKINEAVQYYHGIIKKNGLKIDKILPVSSLMDWQNSKGEELSSSQIDELSKEERENLEIAFDGRYGMEELFDTLEAAIQDFEAQMGFRMAARLNEVVSRISAQLITIFSGLSATIALTPIPTSDIYILLALQTLLVGLIASLSGRDISAESAKEFILSLSGITCTGYGLRLAAQQAVKLANVLWPGSGSAISAAIASTGTTAIGKAAVAYYIDQKSLETVKSRMKIDNNHRERENNA